MIKNILALMIGFIFSTTLFAQSSYYVSKAGNDTNPGTIDKPWKSISKVNSINFNNGDKILFKGGDKFADATLNLNNTGISVESFGTGKAIIGDSLGQLTRTISISADNVTINNIFVYGSSSIGP